jgi:signal transduction histidine kinase/ActR/RegA family two-component response regulator
LNARHPGWFARVWNDFLTCGRMEDSNSPLIRRVKFTNLFGAITVLALYFFCAINFIDGRLFAGWIELALASVGVTLLHLMRRTRRFGLFQNAMLLLQMTLMTFLLYEGGSEQTGLFWWYTIPAGAFFLKGPRVGWLWTGGAIAEFFLMLGLDGAGLIELPYSHNFMLRFMASFTIVSILTWVYENIRHGYEALIERRNREWQDANHQLMLEIQERLRAEEAMQGARQEAERANRAKSEFLSRMSHELRTPMNSILGFAQLMEYDAAEPLTDSQRENVQHILRGGRHLLGLINEVLDLARIESGRMVLALDSVPVGPVLDEVLSTVRPLAEARNLRLQDDSAPVRGRFVLADPNRLRQVLLNLLSNAVKYNREEGLLTLAGSVTPEGRVRLSVTDTGPGLTPEQQAMLFQPFQRLGADRTSVEGTGIGLTITQKLVEAMHGTVGVTSTPGLGSCFSVDLPLAEGEAPPEAAPSDAPAAPPAAAGGPRKVLYIEDDLANLTLVRHLLERRPDTQLLTASQGLLGVELAAAHRPDLILLDLHLPDIDGREVYRRLQDDPATRPLPVVVVSASAMPHEIDAMLEAGVPQYLTKPLDIRQFLETVDRFLTRPTPPQEAP